MMRRYIFTRTGGCLLLAALCIAVFIGGGLSAGDSPSASQQIKRYEARVDELAAKGSALDSGHPLSVRFGKTVEECRALTASVKEVAGKELWQEDCAARMWRLEEAVHRLGMLELRTRIVKALTADDGREPKYGLLAASGLERIVNNKVPAPEATDTVTLTAAAGESVSFRLTLVVFDRGIDKPDKYFQFVTIEQPFASAEGDTIPEKALTPLFEDEAPTDAQRIMLGDFDLARGIQRTDYLTGASQDCLIGLGAQSYIQFLHADTAYGIRVIIDVPADQKAGSYRGTLRVWPMTEEYPAYAHVALDIVDAGAVPEPAMRILGGFNRQAFLYITAVRQKKDVAALDAEKAIARHIAAMAKEHVVLKDEGALAPDDDWLFVPDDPDGPLAMTTTPLRARLLAWQAWAGGKKGIQVATFHDWADSWKRMSIWPGPGSTRGYINYTADDHRIGSLYYASGSRSLRLLMLQEGFQDAAWLDALLARMKSAVDDGMTKKIQSVLERARALAAKPGKATAEEFLAIRREVILLMAQK